MKEIMRQYGSAVIAVVTGALLMLVIMQLPMGEENGMGSRLLEQQALSETDNTAFENYWRSR